MLLIGIYRRMQRVAGALLSNNTVHVVPCVGMLSVSTLARVRVLSNRRLRWWCGLNRSYPFRACCRDSSTSANGTRRCYGTRELESRTTGLFGRPLLNRPDGFAAATQQALQQAEGLVSEIWSLADSPSLRIVDKMDELSDALCRVADLAECIRLVHPNPALSEAAQDACVAINNYVDQLNTDTRLHFSLHLFMTSADYLRFDDVTRRTCELFMHDFEDNGIHLEKGKRERAVDLNCKILQLGHQFVTGTSLPALVPEKKAPFVLRNYFATNSGYTVIDHVPHHSRDSHLRALSYKMHYACTPQQEEVLEEILALRHQLALVAGDETFAHRTLKSCMAQSPEVVAEFLDSLSEKTLPLAEVEVKEMEDLKRSEGEQLGMHALHPWDVIYYTSLAQSKHFRVKSSEFCEYFSLDNCIEGLNNLFRCLFDVHLERVPTEIGEVWHDTVIKLAFIHKVEGLLGYTYCDLFAREGKLMSDCHFTIQGGRETSDGGYQTPIIALCCSFQRRVAGGKVLLSQQSVENLFHEMGHALHSMLGRPKYQNVTGTRCSTDFAEVPSTLMEYFLSDQRVLASFAHHYRTGQTIPEMYVRTFQLSSKLYPAFDVQIQIVYAITDLLLHGRHPLGKPCTQLAADIYQKYAPLQPVDDTTWCLRFNHLYSYGARYYSYLWSRAVSGLIWRKCFRDDPFSREAGEKLRTMLRYGGGLPPMQLVRDMLGFEPSIADLVEALCDDIHQHRHKMKSV